MAKHSVTQMELFQLAPRNDGREKVDWSKGGIKQLSIERFKRFRNFAVDFDSTTLLVGTNSSGKTTVLQAVRLFFWCISTCIRKDKNGYHFAKAVSPFSDFKLIPAHDLRELVFQAISPNSRTRGIVLRGTLESGLTLAFRIYASYSILMVVDPEQQPTLALTEEEKTTIDRPPLYIPGFFGVVTRELLAHDARLEELLNSGHHNEVLRNIILRLKGDEVRIARLIQIIQQEFNIGKVDLPFSQKTSEFLRAEYAEPGVRIPLDFVSAGSGFLQVLQIMAHALQNPSPILLLDEPDAHMHHSLQRSFLRVLRSFAEAEKLQVIMSSHSETFLRDTPLEEVRVIDSTWKEAGKYSNVASLQAELSQAGIWPSRVELAEILRTRRILIVEGSEDEALITRLGRIMYPDWDSTAKLMQIMYSDGSDESTVRKLEYAQEILARVIPDGVRLAHVRDRDLLCNAAVLSVRRDAKARKVPVFVSDVRNRESMMIQPDLIERAARLLMAESTPSQLRQRGAIATLVKNVIKDWCKSQVDDVPVKVQEYNRAWIRRTYEGDDQRKGEKLVAEFIRQSWHEPIAAGEVPWCLVDGKAVIRLVRQQLQPHDICVTDDAVIDAMGLEDFDKSMREAVALVHGWCQK